MRNGRRSVYKAEVGRQNQFSPVKGLALSYDVEEDEEYLDEDEEGLQ